ncbi:MAG: sugar phosphate nucleotidyltransferase [Pyrinomonadaceae bacterium]
MKAMILAAGYGTRLWPLTEDRTKPALPFLGRPLCGYVAEYLARHGCRDVLVNLHHQPESVRESLGDGSRFGVHLEYIMEPEILGTSGAVINARDFFDDEPFLVINGKIITDIDLSTAIDAHKNSDAIATLILQTNPKRQRFSEVLTANGLVTGFGGMPKPVDASATAPLMFTGIQVFSPRIFQYITPGVFSHSVTDVFPRAWAAGETINAHVAEGTWFELSTIERYLAISLALSPNDDARRGEGCVIDKDAGVTNSILWDNVVVGAGAVVEHCVIGDGVIVPAGTVWRGNAVVRSDLVRGKEVPEKALPGAYDGANFVTPFRQ